jgi:hemolysin III
LATQTENKHQVVVIQPKPLLRGWSHAVAAVASLVFTIVLAFVSAYDPPRMLSMIVFGASMVVLYTVSAVYHIGRWTPRVHRVLRSLDHANIFLLIAGTYTPICFNLLEGWFRVFMLATVWVLAAAGMALSVLTLKLPRWVSTLLYIGLGWVSLIALPEMLEAIGWTGLLLLAAGGVSYTVGGVIYALKRPNPFPRVFGFHEIFHLFVIAGSVAFAVVVCVWALPYPRA